MIRQGHDTDTAGAICGTVLGARFGTTWIPTHRLADGSRLERWADAVARAAPPPENRRSFMRHEAELTSRERDFQRGLTESE